jgi:hypothetical protein
MPVLLCLLGLVWAAAHAVIPGLMLERPGGHLQHHHHHDPGAHDALGAYAAYAPTSFALCLVLAVGIALSAVLARRRLEASAASLWLFGLVPLVGFAGHALIALPAHGAPATAVLELAPAFALALLIQLPFALVAVGIGRGILLLAENVARALSGPRSTEAAAARAFALPLAHVAAPRAVPGLRLARAPPAPAVP